VAKLELELNGRLNLLAGQLGTSRRRMPVTRVLKVLLLPPAWFVGSHVLKNDNGVLETVSFNQLSVSIPAKKVISLTDIILIQVEFY